MQSCDLDIFIYMQEVLFLNEEEMKNIRSYLPRVSEIKSISDYFFIFSDTTRLLIIAALSLSEMCVSDICELISVNQTTVSHQLKFLRDMKIVDYRRVGSVILYRIINPYVNDVITLGINQINLINYR